MAKISQLPDFVDLSGDETLPLRQGDQTVRAKIDGKLADFFNKNTSTKDRFPDPKRLISFMDRERREFGHVNQEGRFDISLTDVKFEGWTIENFPRLEAGNRVAILSADGRLLGWLNPQGDASDLQGQLSDLAGTRASAADRVNEFLDSYGLPLRYYFNEHLLRRYRYLRRIRLLGEAAQISVALIGDSFTHAFSRYSGPVAEQLIAELGDAGGGWTGYGAASGIFINGNARPSLYGLLISGSGWDATSYYSGPSPDLAQLTSVTAGDKITRTGPDAAALSAFQLFWVNSANGVARYRWNAGAWTNINTQGTLGELSWADLDQNQPGAGTWTIEIEVVSGSVTLCGDNCQTANSGVVVHKLGATGSQAWHWEQVNAAQWKAGLQQLNPQIVTIMHGTNDQGAGRTPAQFKLSLETIIANVRDAMPLVDIMVAMPAENQRDDNDYPMTDYALIGRQVAAQQNCTYLDTQYLFGDDPAEYASDGPRPLNNPDKVHPQPETGGRVIADAFLRIFNLV